MTAHPTTPLIITNGYINEDSIAGSVATPVDIDFPEEDYYIITGVKAGFTAPRKGLHNMGGRHRSTKHHSRTSM